MMRNLILLILALCTASLHAEVKLQKQGTATQLVVNGKPMLLLGGELSNSAATSVADIDEVMPRMHKLGLNTVFVPAYWEFIEPQEGKFDFTLVDRVITKARENDLKIVFLWFGAWKNSMSCYAPAWFKTDTKRFPRSLTETGKPLEIASCFSDNVLQADRRAFCKLMEHLKATDSRENTVVMVQVENEIGMLESARDFSPLANAAYKQQVPKELIAALSKGNGSKGTGKSTDNGLKAKQGTWAEVFGSDVYGQEKFQAYWYAKYVEQIAKAGKAVYDIPMYVNAAMNSRGRKPGEYPSAGPLAHLFDIWKHAAPSIDVCAPDIYDNGYKGWVSQYKTANNPFLTPEVRLGDYCGVRAIYTFGELDAISYSPFAIDQGADQTTSHVTQGYSILNALTPWLTDRQGQGKTWGLLFDQQDKERVINDGNIVMTCRHFFTLPWDPRATDGSAWPEGGGLIMRLAKNEYIIAGSGVVVTFQTASEKQQSEEKKLGEDGFVDNGNETNKNAAKTYAKRFTGKRLGLASVDQITVNADGTPQLLRRDNGDQSHQGRHARISCGEYKILHVKLYEY